MPVSCLSKDKVDPLRAAFQSCDLSQIRTALGQSFAPDADIKLGHPFQSLIGPEVLWERVYAPLLAAMPDLERRDFIVMSGPRWRAGAPQGTGQSETWVGLGGNFVGTLKAPWLGIPPTGRPVYFRYQEYMRVEAGQIVEMEALWDIPQLMMQAGVWPMAPQPGENWMCPGPADGSGLITGPYDAERSYASLQKVWDMLHDLQQGDATHPERGLGGYWHPHALWHGPAGLGTARGHRGIAERIFSGFRTGLSDNTRHLQEGVFFGDQHLVAFSGWPSGTATHSGDGFLGLAPTGRRVTRRSLDFWRVEDGLIRECWVMVDMLDLYRQLGVDVFARIARLYPESSAA